MRHEEKFICSDKQLALIQQRLKTLLAFDPHQKSDKYHIRSLYLDTFDDRLYRESLDGVDGRSKYRVRFYDMDSSLFRLERKDTKRNLKRKSSAAVDMSYVRSLLDGKDAPSGKDELSNEVYAMWRSEGLHPVAIVDYHRTAFVHPVGNIRITIDRDIACSFTTAALLDPHALLIPVMPEGKHILEVKYDGIFPGYLAKLMDIGSLEQVSFSKYAYARNVTDNNGRKEEGYEF